MRVIVNLLMAGAIAYALVLLLVFLLQPRLVYFPQVEHELAATPRGSGLDFEEVWLQTADAEKLHAWWTPAPAARGAVLILHGNAGNISHRIDYLKMFQRMGYATLLIDYRGYGRSSGAPSEQGTYVDAGAAWQYLLDRRQLKPQDIVVFGESLGGGVATWLAAQHPPRALILASTFTSVPALGAEVYPWLPVRLLARIRYDNLQRIAQIGVPVLIAHSREDDIIPFAHGEALFAAAHQPKQLLVLSGGHNEGFLFTRDEWAAAVGTFLESARRR